MGGHFSQVSNIPCIYRATYLLTVPTTTTARRRGGGTSDALLAWRVVMLMASLQPNAGLGQPLPASMGDGPSTSLMERTRSPTSRPATHPTRPDPRENASMTLQKTHGAPTCMRLRPRLRQRRDAAAAAAADATWRSRDSGGIGARPQGREHAPRKAAKETRTANAQARPPRPAFARTTRTEPAPGLRSGDRPAAKSWARHRPLGTLARRQRVSHA